MTSILPLDHVSNLLIVDDSERNLVLIQRIFSQPQYRIDTAMDGAEALEMISRKNYDLVLLDVMMPVMNGFEALQCIRENDQTASLPVILVSALCDSVDIIRGLELGANDYITKPIDIGIARARVKTQVDLKYLMDQRTETIRHMEESKVIRENFFRIASHDLKVPINNLTMSHDLLRDMLDPHDEVVQIILDTMSNTAQAMYEVVSEFLDSAILESGEVNINLQNVSISDLIKEVVNSQLIYAEDKDVSLQVHHSTETVICDPLRMIQAVTNLINNAIKYSPHGSVVNIWTDSDDNYVRLLIADEGPGIPTQERIQLFQPFGKLSTRPTGGESSHGLGLWIAKQLVELQDSQIGMESPAEGGSIFWVMIPISKKELAL